MKKFLTGTISAIFAVSALLAVAATALGRYYYNVFPAGAFLYAFEDSSFSEDSMGGMYCTGMTAAEIAASFDASYNLKDDKAVVWTADGKAHELLFDEYGITVSFEPAVSEKLREYGQDHFQWLADFLAGSWQAVYVYPHYQYDLAVIRARLQEQDWLNENLYNPENMVSIVRSDGAGYILVDETKDLLLKQEAVEFISTAIVNQLTIANKNHQPPDMTIDLTEDGYREKCYTDIPYTAKMKDTLSKWKGVEAFQNFKLTYKFGDCEEIIDRDVAADWIMLDEDGEIVYDENNIPVLDETMIEEYVAYLSATYNTVGREREFKATRGDIVTIGGGSYGNELDGKAEYEFLLDAFRNKKGGVRVPRYTAEAKEQGTDDIGDTYIEIDMGSQHMYYYVEGELIMDTPVVTGNTSRKWGTPSKVCYVYFKQRNRVLRGADYATPVKYWMAVDGRIGIHDATWRKEFGGEIYKTDGSHGCINTPLSCMSELYELVEVGTPVVLFY